MRHTISLLTDEVSPDIDVALAFAAGEGLTSVDVRSIDGINFLSLGADRQRQVAQRIRAAGMAVGCLATPLLKWPAPGRAAARMGDQFGFDRAGRSDAALYADAIAAADLLGTRHLRIFSLLTCDGFRQDDLAPDLEALLALAERHDKVLHVENEPVCNVASVADLLALTTRFPHPRLRALLDVANHTGAVGTPPAVADCVLLMPSVDILHFKDRSLSRRRCVPMGEGDVPFAALLPACLAAAGDRTLTLTIETHVPDDGPAATRQNIRALRDLLRAGTAAA